MSVLGETRRHWASDVLGTGYDEFKSPTGLTGLAKVRDGQLHVLAVYAPSPGHGQLRGFIELCKQEYDVIYVWDVSNEDLAVTLRRYGFKAIIGNDPDNNDLLSGYVFHNRCCSDWSDKARHCPIHSRPGWARPISNNDKSRAAVARLSPSKEEKKNRAYLNRPATLLVIAFHR